MKRFIFTIIIVCAFITASSNADYVASWTDGTLGAEASFTITGTTLTVELTNTSVGTTAAPAELLTSVYFNISGEPTLSNFTADGDLWLAHRYAPDEDIANISLVQPPGAPLLGMQGAGWLFVDYRTSVGGPGATPEMPYSYAIGTAGNNDLTPYNIPGMDGPETGIFVGDDISTQNLDGYYLVKDMMTFTFTIPSGITESMIGPVAFGWGTAPDRFVPLPGTILLGLLGLGVGGLKLRKTMK